jgi:tRNA(Ile)-lysidine synthase
VLLGHTRDDQAETVLLGLARGSGARSLSGMPPRTGRFRRPLLELGRAVTLAACADQGLTPWDDPHNADPAYARARVRHDVLPIMEAALGPGVAEALARTAGQLRADADALDGWAAEAYAHCLDPDGHLEVAALERLPGAVRTRVLRRAALAAGSPATDLTAGHVDALDRLVQEWHGQGPLDLPANVSATRREGRIVMSRESR